MSKQSVAVTATVLGTAVQNVTQTCITCVFGGNIINVAGNNNNISAVNQSMSIVVDAPCAAKVLQAADFKNQLQTDVSQLLKNQEVALTQWMDGSTDSVGAAINQTVSTSVTANTVQNCLASIDSQNILNVTGSDNVLTRIAQNSVSNLMTQCLLGQDQTSAAVTDITNAVNQHSEYTSKNPLAFISDAFEAVMGSAMAALAAVFIVIICFVALFVLMRHRGKKSRPLVIQSGRDYGAARAVY